MIDCLIKLLNVQRQIIFPSSEREQVHEHVNNTDVIREMGQPSTTTLYGELGTYGELGSDGKIAFCRSCISPTLFRLCISVSLKCTIKDHSTLQT